MTLEQSMRAYIQRNREARESHASRFSGLIRSIANGTEYDFNPEDTDGQSSQLPGQEGQAGAGDGNGGPAGTAVQPEAAGEAAVS